MKFFLDTANLSEIQRALAWRIIDGITTNPSLLAKEGVPPEEQLRLICSLVNGDVSAPVTSNTLEGMLAEGRSLSKLHKNIVVKIPVTPDGIAAVATLAREGIRTNVTLCFSPAQALLAAKAGATFVSPFMARVEDQGGSGFEFLQDIAVIYKNFGYPTQILAASVRGQHHLLQAAKAGAHAATMSFKLIESLFGHPLTEAGLAQFMADYNNAFAWSAKT